MNNSKTRISWIEYAKRLAQTAALRSEDPYVQVGVVAFRHDNSVAAAGYNGPPSGIDIEWSDRDARRKRVVHAEQNCLRYCKPGECSYIVSTLMPCTNCLALIASYGIKKVYFMEHYDAESLKIAEEFGITLEKI